MELSINYLAVLLAAIVSYAIGAWWHSPWGFGKQWQRMMGLSHDSMKNMPLTATQAMLIGFIMTVLVSYVLAHFVVLFNVIVWQDALVLGFWVWLGFLMPTLANGWMWEGKTFKLFLFNAVYALVNIEILAVVLGLWR